LLIELLAASGDLQTAQLQYEAYAEALERELGARPEHHLTALYKDIKSGRYKSKHQALGTSARDESLPHWLTSFIGREDDIARLTELLQKKGFVSIVGPGGVGKTRLAAECARALQQGYMDGVCFLDFSACGREALLARTAQGLGLSICAGESPLTLARRLSGRHMLIIMDNCEALAPECSALASAFRAEAEGCSLIVTSTQALGARTEIVYFLETLPVPGLDDEAQAIRENAAVRLFMDRARAAAPSMSLDGQETTIALLARRLEGIALAIELAAARCRSIPPAELLASLQEPLALEEPLLDALPLRQRTLKAVIAWSWSLLNAEERRCMEALALCEGGFNLDSAEALIGCPPLSVLPQLCDKSLLMLDGRQRWPPRWKLLESVRSYALARLLQSARAQEAEETYRRHFVGRALRLGAALSLIRDRADLDGIKDDWLNICAALRSSIRHGAQGAALAALLALRQYILLRDGIHELGLLLALINVSDLRSAVDEAAFEELSALCAWFAQDSVSLANRSSRASELWASYGEELAARRSELTQLTFGTIKREEYAYSLERLESSAELFLKAGKTGLAIECYTRLCARVLNWHGGSFSYAFAILDRARDLARELKDIASLSDCAWFGVQQARWLGDERRALRCIAELRRYDAELGSVLTLADSLALLASWHFDEGEYDDGLKSARESSSLYRRLGLAQFSLDKRIVEAECLQALGRREDAQELLRAAAEEAQPYAGLALLLRNRLALQLAADGKAELALRALDGWQSPSPADAFDLARYELFRARLLLSLDREAAAAEGFARAEPGLREGGNIEYAAALTRYQVFLRAKDEPLAALTFVKEALSANEDSATCFELAWRACIGARALGALGRNDLALAAARLAWRYASGTKSTFLYPERAVFLRVRRAAAQAANSRSAPSYGKNAGRSRGASGSQDDINAFIEALRYILSALK
jgi:predicted ATPase